MQGSRTAWARHGPARIFGHDMVLLVFLGATWSNPRTAVKNTELIITLAATVDITHQREYPPRNISIQVLNFGNTCVLSRDLWKGFYAQMIARVDYTVPTPRDRATVDHTHVRDLYVYLSAQNDLDDLQVAMTDGSVRRVEWSRHNPSHDTPTPLSPPLHKDRLVFISMSSDQLIREITSGLQELGF